MKIICYFLALWKRYFDRENETARATASLAFNQQAAQNLMNYDYPLIGEVLYTAILNTSEITGIVPLRAVEQLFFNVPIKQAKEGYLIFCYSCFYRRSYAPTADKIRRILQNEITVLAGFYNLPALSLAVNFGADSRVYFGVCYTADKNKGITI